MLTIVNVTIAIVQTSPHSPVTSKPHFLKWRDLEVIGGAGQVRTKVDFTFELVA
jgi:hypothetical protein